MGKFVRYSLCFTKITQFAFAGLCLLAVLISILPTQDDEYLDSDLETERVKQLVNGRDFKGRLPIEMAINNNDCQRAVHLIHRGADVSLRDSKGRLPVEAAMDLQNDEDIYYLLKHLVSVGASLMDVPKEKRNTPAWQRAYQEDK